MIFLLYLIFLSLFFCFLFFIIILSLHSFFEYNKKGEMFSSNENYQQSVDKSTVRISDPSMISSQFSSMKLSDVSSSGFDLVVPGHDAEFDIIDSLDYDDVDTGLFGK